jgi:hypothetical protein
VGSLAPGGAEPAVVTRRPAIIVLGVAAAAGIVTLIVALTTAPGPRPPALPASGILADVAVNPQSAYVGDALVARIDVLVDRRRIDPSTLAVRGSFAPYVAGAPSIERRDVGDASRVKHTLRLRCEVRPCLPPDPERSGRRTFVLPALRVLFRRTDGSNGSVLLPLPALEILSRLSRSDAALVEDFAVIPFRASLAPDPIRYAVSPTLLAGLLLAAAALLLTAAGWLLLRYGPRRKEPAAPEPPPEPPVVLSPLERALAVVERARARGSIPDERKALELLARELGRNGDPELAATAKGLAWSAQGPTAAGTLALTADVRSVIEGSSDGHP